MQWTALNRSKSQNKDVTEEPRMTACVYQRRCQTNARVFRFSLNSGPSAF